MPLANEVSAVMHAAVWLLAATALAMPSLPAGAATTVEELELGKLSYDKCIGCHSPERNRAGPLHCGLFGRESGTVRGYIYSQAMRDAGITWNSETLNRFLKAPMDMVPGTSMGFSGIANDAERRSLVAWLETLTASSDLCEGVSEH